MAEQLILRPGDGESSICKISPNPDLTLGTTPGLMKSINEDQIGYLRHNDITRVCVSDGHWGNGAAEIITAYWLNDNLAFPQTRKDALAQTQTLQHSLADTYIRPNMDERYDRPPEASFLAMELGQQVMRVVSYGDCRLLVARPTITSNVPYYRHAQLATWLGVFSLYGLHQRVPVGEALEYKCLTLLEGDRILMYSDGVDECKYGKSTINDIELAATTRSMIAESTFDEIMRIVFNEGAEDNASLAVINVS